MAGLIISTIKGKYIQLHPGQALMKDSRLFHLSCVVGQRPHLWRLSPTFPSTLTLKEKSHISPFMSEKNSKLSLFIVLFLCKNQINMILNVICSFFFPQKDQRAILRALLHCCHSHSKRCCYSNYFQSSVFQMFTNQISAGMLKGM